jgi:hypothetical protein
MKNSKNKQPEKEKNKKMILLSLMQKRRKELNFMVVRKLGKIHRLSIIMENKILSNLVLNFKL